MVDAGSAGPSSTRLRLDHVGLNVADLAAAQRWYCEAFGFEPEFATRIEAIDLDLVMLLHPGRGDRLELLHRGGSTPGRSTPGRSTLGPRAQDPAGAALVAGFGHVAFELADLDAGYDRLLTLGARPVMAPGASPEPNVRMAFVADPEGNLIELLDRTSSFP